MYIYIHILFIIYLLQNDAVKTHYRVLNDWTVSGRKTINYGRRQRQRSWLNWQCYWSMCV